MESGSNQVAISSRKLGGQRTVVVSELTEYALYANVTGNIDPGFGKNTAEAILSSTNPIDYDIIVVEFSRLNKLEAAVIKELALINKRFSEEGVDVVFCGIMKEKSPEAGGHDLCFVRNLQEALAEVLGRKGSKGASLSGK